MNLQAWNAHILSEKKKTLISQREINTLHFEAAETWFSRERNDEWITLIWFDGATLGQLAKVRLIFLCHVSDKEAYIVLKARRPRYAKKLEVTALMYCSLLFLQLCDELMVPRHCMCGVFTYMYLRSYPNVGIIHHTLSVWGVYIYIYLQIRTLRYCDKIKAPSCCVWKWMFKFQRGCLELHSPMVCLVTVVVFNLLALLPAMTCRTAGRSIKPSNLVGYTTINNLPTSPNYFPLLNKISNWFIRMFSCVNLEGAYQQIHHAEKIPWHDHSRVIIWN